MPERVLIVDPQPFFCESLGVALSSTDLIVVGWTTDEVEASRVAAALSPDLVLTELDLAAGSGLNLVRKLHDRVRFVVLTRRHEGDVVLDAAAAGAVGCISHDVPLPKLRGLLTSATPGRFVADPDRLIDVLRRAGASRNEDPSRARIGALTPREREVLHLLASGLDNEAIARHLYLSARTVRTHVGNILRKLQVHSRAEAARIAVSAGEFSRSTADVLRIEGPSWGAP
jgi:DNA-binding NarL/FixJ family response regulator